MRRSTTLKTISDLARETGCPGPTVYHWIMYARLVPQPTVVVGKRKHYSDAAYVAALGVVKELRAKIA